MCASLYDIEQLKFKIVIKLFLNAINVALNFILKCSVMLHFVLNAFLTYDALMIYFQCHIQAYMFKYDSTHGVFDGTIRVIDESTLEINGKTIKVESKRYSLLNAHVITIYIFSTRRILVMKIDSAS